MALKGKGSTWQRKEQERKRINKVATLKKYARLCKAEGIESRRVNTGPRKNDSNSKPEPKHGEESEDESEEEDKPKKLPKKRKNKSPAVNEKEEQKEKAKAQISDRIRAMEEALEKRKKLKKVLTKKTAKGQPVMKGRINHILDKLMKEKA